MANQYFFDNIEFYKEIEFKDTEIGRIPKEWKVVRLAKTIEYKKGKKPLKLVENQEDSALIPYLTAEYMRGSQLPKFCSSSDPNIIKVDKTDIIMIWDGSYSGHVFTGFEGALASTMIKIKPKTILNSKFLYYYLTRNFQIFSTTTIGTGIPHVSKMIFENFLLILPPLPEQQKIAEILSTIDKAIELTDKIIEDTERLKKGLMDKLLTEGVNIFALEKDKIIDIANKLNDAEDLEYELSVYLKDKFPDYNIEVKDDLITVKDREHNLFAIVVKKHASIAEIKKDIEKLEDIMDSYCETIFIGFDVDEKVLGLSNKVNFLLVNRDGYKVKFREREFKDTEIGRIPKEWEVVKLRDVTNEIKTGFACGKRDNNGILQLRMDNINSDGSINTSTGVKVPFSENMQDYLLKPGDILFNNTNSADLIGKTALFRGEFSKCVYSNHLTRIRVNRNKVFPEWILYIFVRYWQLGIFKTLRHQHVHQAGINKSDLINLKLPIAPILEQQKIAEILSTIDDKLEIERKEKERLEKIKKAMMDLLLTGKVRVRV